MATVRTLLAGDTTKPNPFTVTIVANPALEMPIDSGVFSRDPILDDENGFDVAAGRIIDALFGRLPGQRENIFSDLDLAQAVRIVSIFDATLTPNTANALAGHAKSVPGQLEARRTRTQPFLTRFGFTTDVNYAVSASATHRRASAWYTTDDESSPGTPFTLHGESKNHRTRCLIPGSIAIHQDTELLDALHEFQHAISSYDNGKIVDLYTNSPAAVNSRRGRPIPNVFGTYNGTTFNTDMPRDSIGYGPLWRSFHCEHIAPAELLLMDDYRLTRPPSVPIQCQNDLITRQFVIDRMRVKVNR